MNLNPQDTVAVSGGGYTYGQAESIEVAGQYVPAGAGLELGSRAWFLLAEVTGLLFVLLSTFFIFAVPMAITRPGRIGAMINRSIKRSLDIVGATVGLLLSAPIMLVLPLIIKLDSHGPVFYTQMRVGINRRKSNRRYCNKVGIEDDSRRRERRRVDYKGRPFQVIKFRTMVNDAETKSGPVWATKNDSRITRIGAFMRKTRLDEVPQFINVLKGDMSLVGPRPERPHFVMDLATKIDNYAERLQVKPGITGLAQVESGYDSSVASVARKVSYDLEYIRESSLWYDIKILLKTVVVVFTGRGAC